MATATYNAHSATRGAQGKGLFARIFDAMIRVAENNPRVRQAQRLHAMTDAELAARGIKRTEIGQHVFRDMAYM